MTTPRPFAGARARIPFAQSLPFARPFIFALAAVYPAYWLAQSTLGALPALLRVAFAGHEIKMFRISVSGVFILSAPASGSPAPADGFRNLGAVSLLAVLLSAVLCAGLLFLARRRSLFLPSLFIALLGFVGFEQMLYRLWSQSPGLAWFAGAALYFIVWTLGLHCWLAAALPSASRYGSRFGAALLGFTLPLFLLWLTLHLFVGMSLMRPATWLFIPGLLPIALASLRLRPALAREGNRYIAWKWPAVAAAVSIVAFSLLSWGGNALDSAFVQHQAAQADAAVAVLPAPSPTAPYPRDFFQRGVNFTAEFPAPYASVDALHSLARLPAYGVDSVALVAYGWSRPGQPAIHLSPGLRTWESDQGVEDLARLAHSLGMKVLLKPQLWVRGGSTTDLDFPDLAERRRWFNQYALFIDHYARLAARVHADVFCVGVELPRLTRDAAAWRKIIAGVRAIYPGPLVYAANFGPDFRSVTFWDALDYIGLDEYYPLPPDLSTSRLVRRVERVAIAYRRPVIFTEVGFTSTRHPEANPWDSTRRPHSMADQQRCYEAIFRAFYDKPWFMGMYWWKIGTNGAGGPSDDSFTPWGKPAMEVVREWYLHASHPAYVRSASPSGQ